MMPIVRSAALSALTTLLVAAALSGCAVFGGQTQKREFAIESAWTRATAKKDFLGFRRMNRMTPIVLDNLVIQANSIDGILAYDRKSGREQWRLDLVNGVEGGTQVVGDRLYFGASDGQFYCVNVLNGRVLWTFAVKAETLAPPTVEEGVVYFQNGADVVYALDAATGKQLWLYNRQVTASLSIRATTRPVVAGEQLIAGFADGFVVALKKRDGGLLWERKLGRGTRFRDVDTTPVVDGGITYVASYDAALYALKTETGEILWSVEDGAYAPVTLGRDRFADRLYYSTASGKILILDKRSGKQLGSIAVTKGIPTQVSLYKDFLIYGESEGSLVVANADNGSTVARFAPGHGLVSRPAVVDQTGEAFFISNDANLFALKMGYRRVGDRLPWQSEEN